MESNNTINENTSNRSDSESKRRKKVRIREKTVIKKKERGVVPYIFIPLSFVLISLIAVIPLFVGFVNYCVGTVHTIQKTLVQDYSDTEVYSYRFDNKTLVYENGRFGVCEKIGVLKCESVGINTDVYYGVNRVSLRSGAGVSSKSNFGTYDMKLNIAGYSTKAFKGLNNVSVGDTITFETTEKIYEYTVESNTVGSYPEDDSVSGMILSCDVESKAFSAIANEKRYVVASVTSMKNKKGE